MKKILLIILLTIPFVFFGQSKLHDWNDSFYSKHNYISFSKLEIVNTDIDVNNIDYELFNAAIFYCTNKERIKYNMVPFIHSSLLEKAAQGHSKDMVTYNFYSHTSPVRGKRNMSDRITAVGITFSNCAVAENICNQFERNPTYWTFALKLVEGWMESSGHRANILNSNYYYLGCGVFYYKNPEFVDYFWVKSTQNFSSCHENLNTRNTKNKKINGKLIIGSSISVIISLLLIL